MSQWLIALAPVVLKAVLDLLVRIYERRTQPAVDKPYRRRRKRRIA